MVEILFGNRMLPRHIPPMKVPSSTPTEQPSSDYLDKWFPNDADGDLYKMEVQWRNYQEPVIQAGYLSCTMENFVLPDGSRLFLSLGNAVPGGAPGTVAGSDDTVSADANESAAGPGAAAAGGASTQAAPIETVATGSGGQAPAGALNENRRGSISSMVKPDTGQANRAENVMRSCVSFLLRRTADSLSPSFTGRGLG